MSEEQLVYDYIVRAASYQSNDICVVDINGYSFPMQTSLGLLISTKIYANYQADATSRSFKFNCDITDTKIYQILSQFFARGILSYTKDENICLDLYNVGQTLGITVLMEPYTKILNDSDLKIENAFEHFNINRLVNNGSKEIDFIAQHLSKFNRDKLFNFLFNNEYDVVERILSNQNLTVRHENDLLLLIIDLSRRKIEYFKLLKYIIPNLCSETVISQFCEYVDEFYDSLSANDGFNLVWSFSKSLLQNYNLKPVDNILNDDNCTFKSSSLSEKLVYINIDSPIPSSEYNEKEFYTKDEPNSWISCELENIYVIPNQYHILSRREYDLDLLQNWRLEGITLDGRTVVLDEHENDPFKQNEGRNFSINIREKIVKFKLIQTGPSTTGYDFLFIQEFNISGLAFKM